MSGPSQHRTSVANPLPLRPIQRDRHDGRHAPAHTRACDVPDHCARQLAAAADEIVAIADDVAPIKERIDAAQKRIMALSDTATLGAREPQLVGELMPKYPR